MSDLLNFIREQQPEFQSKTRLWSLYSDFSAQRRTNPDGFSANISAWRSALHNAAGAGLLPGNNTFTFDGRNGSLGKALEYREGGFGRPAALGAVFDELIKQNDVIPLKEYNNSKRSVYDKSWTVNLPSVWQGARWALGQLGILGEDENDGAVASTTMDQEFVLMDVLKETTLKVLSALEDRASTTSELTFSLETFTATASSILKETNIRLTPRDVTIMCTYLTRDLCIAALYTSPAGKTVIRLDNTAPPTRDSPMPAPPITEKDMTVAELNTLIHTLNTQVSHLNNQISNLTSQLQTSMAEKKPKDQLLPLLRRRKALESTLSARSSSLEQIESVLRGIDDATTNIEISNALSSSSKVLKGLNERVGGVEGVDKITERMREEMVKTQEIGDVLAEPGAEGVDEVGVEEEFEGLVREREREEREQGVKEREREEKKREKQREAEVNALPDVPASEPGTQRQTTTEERSQGERSPEKSATNDDSVENAINALGAMSIQDAGKGVAEREG